MRSASQAIAVDVLVPVHHVDADQVQPILVEHLQWEAAPPVAIK